MPEKINKYLIYTWNVNGIRAIEKKGFLDWFKKSKGDIICLQETKAQPDQVPENIKNVNGYKSFWFSAERKGYSSVAIFSKPETLNVYNGFGNPKFDTEGRVIIAEYEKFVVVNVYFPNGGRGPERVKYKLDFYDELFYFLNKKFKSNKGVIVTGDYNTAHKEIDLAKPEQWSKISGFLKEERDWIDKIINLGYTDVFRKFNNKEGQYTYWDQISRARERNEGWRIDFFMVSNNIVDKIKDAKIHQDVLGSDHCPVSIRLEI